MQMNSKYLVFYFEGRDEELDQDELDVEQLAKDASNSTDSPHQVALAAAEKLAAPLASGREKKEWLADFADEIKAEDDPNTAYAHYLQGRIDQTAAVVEDEMLELMDPRENEEEDDDDGDDDDDCEDDSDDDDDGDDD